MNFWITELWTKMTKLINLKKEASCDLRNANTCIIPHNKSIILQTAKIRVAKVHDYGKVKIVNNTTE